MWARRASLLFSGNTYDDCDESLGKFEGCTKAYSWSSADQERHFPLALRDVAYKCYMGNKQLSWPELIAVFRYEFGRMQVDYDLAGVAGKMGRDDNQFSYVYNVLACCRTKNSMWLRKKIISAVWGVGAVTQKALCVWWTNHGWWIYREIGKRYANEAVWFKKYLSINN